MRCSTGSVLRFSRCFNLGIPLKKEIHEWAKCLHLGILCPKSVIFSPIGNYFSGSAVVSQKSSTPTFVYIYPWHWVSHSGDDIYPICQINLCCLECASLADISSFIADILSVIIPSLALSIIMSSYLYLYATTTQHQ